MRLRPGAVVVVTGGARGIGLATARALAARGARVWIGDLDAELAEREAATFGARGAALDVADRDSFAALLDSARAADGPLDALVNNAGIMPFGAFLDQDHALAERTIAVNLVGVINGMRLALPEMTEQGSGHVVNVASLAARFPVPGSAVYSATKSGVLGLTDAVRRELRGTGVRLTTVLPTMVSTELSSGAPAGRGVTAVSPELVAAAIVRALERPRNTVVVPRRLGLIARLVPLAPARVEAMVRRLVGDDRLLTRLDSEARAAYERRLTERLP